MIVELDENESSDAIYTLVHEIIRAGHGVVNLVRLFGRSDAVEDAALFPVNFLLV